MKTKLRVLKPMMASFHLMSSCPSVKFLEVDCERKFIVSSKLISKGTIKTEDKAVTILYHHKS